MRRAFFILVAAVAFGSAAVSQAFAQDSGKSGQGGTTLRLPPAVPGAPANSSPQGAPPPPAQAATPAPPPAQPDAPRALDNFVDINKRVAATFSPSGFKLPGLMSAINDGRAQEVPDDEKTRALVFSILKAFADNCGPATRDVSEAAAMYVSKTVRRANRGDGFNALGELLKDVATMRDAGLASGDIAGSIRSFQDKHAVLLQEGIDDGQLLLARHPCGSPVQAKFSNNLYGVIMSRAGHDAAPYDEIRFWALMSPEYRQQNNIPDPAVELAKRKTAELKRSAEKSCSQSFERPGFCKCTIGKLDNGGITDADWTALSGNFRTVAVLGKDRGEVMAAVRSCYQ